MPIVELSNGMKIEFPDGMSDEAMEREIHRVVETQRQGKEQALQPMSWGDVASGAIEKLPSSASRFAGDMADMVMNPIDTVSNIAGTVAGYGQKAGKALGVNLGEGYISNADSVSQFFADRYGGVEAFKRTMANDPVGFAADLASVLTGAGGVLRGAGTAAARGAAMAGRSGSRIAAGLTRAGEVAGKVGNAIDPVSLSVQGARKALNATGLLEKLGNVANDATHGASRRLYTKALLANGNLTPAERSALADTGIREGLTFNDAGVSKLDARMDGIGKEIGNVIADQDSLEKAGLSPRTIDPWDVAVRAEERMRNESPYGEVNSGLYKNQIARGVDDFVADPRWIGEMMTTGQAQKQKTALYDLLEKDFNKRGTALAETRKSIARELRDEIERTTPDVVPLNKEYGELARLKPHLLTAAKRADNNLVVPLTSAVFASGLWDGALSSPRSLLNAAAGTGLFTSAFSRPLQARAALAINNLPNRGRQVAAKVTPILRGGGIVERAEDQDVPLDLLRLLNGE